jgi:hypothetical protein
MNLRAGILVGLVSLLFASANAQEPQEASVISINDDLCLSEQAFQAELKQDDLLAYRRLARHFQACAGGELRALGYLEKAAEVGTALDALRYAEGMESIRGERDAVKAYLRAARRGDSIAQQWIAKYIEREKAGSAESADWIENAARQGDWAAMVQLSDMRKGVSPVVAAAWLKIAAERAPARRAVDLRALAETRMTELTVRQRTLLDEVLEELAETVAPKR